MQNEVGTQDWRYFMYAEVENITSTIATLKMQIECEILVKIIITRKFEKTLYN